MILQGYESCSPFFRQEIIHAAQMLPQLDED